MTQTVSRLYAAAADAEKAAAELNRIPPTYETFERYRLEAMVADSRKDWKRADSFYEIAAGMTTKPASIYNNWGFSKLSRQDFAGAERLFVQAITFDDSLFTAKNNLVMARGAQRKYDLHRPLLGQLFSLGIPQHDLFLAPAR